MAQQFLHVFRLTVEGLPEKVEFRMFHELNDVTEVTDAFSKYVARQEDDFLPLGPAAAVRANRILHVAHIRVEAAPTT